MPQNVGKNFKELWQSKISIKRYNLLSIQAQHLTPNVHHETNSLLLLFTELSK